MIAQLQATSAASNAAVAGQPPKNGAVEGFTALMQGVAKQETAPQPQIKTPKTAAPETDGAADTLPEGIDPETAEGLLALMDHTIADLEETNGKVTPKAALAAFAGSLGEAPPDGVGALEAVAQLADPTLEAALEEKIAGALRIPTPSSQLSIASAVIPAIARGSMGTVQEKQVPNMLKAEGDGFAQIASRTPKMATADVAMVGDAQMSRLSTDAKIDASTTVAKTIDASAGITDPRVAATDKLSAVIADPRMAAADQSSAAVEYSKAPQPGVNAPAAEAALREVAALTAPQAPQSETLRLSPPQPTPAPAPNPAAAPEEQLRQHVAQQIRGLDTGDNKLRFSLSPYGMGEIEIEVVRSEAGRLQIAMTTESASVLNMLRQDRDQLLDALQSRGISADNADLDFQTFGERGRNGGQQGGPEFTTNLSQADDPQGSDAQPLAPTPSPSLIAGQLDILT